MKKVYFAGSIRGGRQDAALYGEMIAYLEDRGYEVLTEHVGLESLQEEGERTMTEEEIFQRDMAWLTESDLVVAECTTPSHGVGYELARARDMGKEVHIFYDLTRGRLSAMLAGDRYYILHPYATHEELFEALDRIAPQAR
ncbi:MAG: nucleoside 2-deoxyribosyltransferase [Clostridia bacterium]|nr:nucleoside 2-deoxyribosyltransferase [Clostridia bacterium]MBR0356361.1 nucleoside 2-deoxyribosyltransferase [Clostridia bacterium]